MQFLSDIWLVVRSYARTIRVNDVVDILIVAYFIYTILTVVRRTSAGGVVKGIILLLAAFWIASVLRLTLVSFILRQVLAIGVISLIILFQPELRRFLDSFGNSSWRAFGGRFARSEEHTIVTAVAVATDLARTKTGALIVFERATGLSEFSATGTILNADISLELLKNIFFKDSPLHDGAVIIRRDSLYAAACMLPLSNNSSLPRDIGMRHRAAIGLTERSDAIALVVSEETGSISVSESGMIKRHLTREALDKLLRNLLSDQTERRGILRSVRDAVKRRGTAR